MCHEACTIAVKMLWGNELSLGPVAGEGHVPTSGCA